MTTVRILPEILSNRIAAGEVVERPCSVVKELVENSIDAHAAAITVEVVKGGKSLIRVSDDGIGLSRDDALLSIERYATSKLKNNEDLFCISTMGFRGEALPSIASVSRFTLVTRPEHTDTGTKIEISGGRVQTVSDIGAPVGTMVEVKNLFFNTPARKKFLKSDNTEIAHITDTLSGMALGHPHIRFRLFSNNVLLKNFPSSDDLFQRAVHVLGSDVSKKIYDIRYNDPHIRINGYGVNPSITRSSASRIFLFVNRRLIYDRGLISAIFQGYRGRLMKGRYPLVVLCIEIAHDQVDVNVHPTKREVRFLDHQRVYESVAKAIETAFLSARKDIPGDTTGPGTARATKEPIAPASWDCPTIEAGGVSRVEQSVIEWGEPENRSIDGKIETNAGVSTVIGQVMGTYILAESEAGLMLVDQHAAHERIVYEALKKRAASLETASQTLVVPETLELNYRESDILSGLLEELASLGIRIEPFGGNTFVVKSIPSLISQKEIKPIIIGVIEKIATEKNGFSNAGWLEDALILMACHTAIRANATLSLKQMQQLLVDLEKCDNPLHCPHGRPIVVTMTKSELEKLFKRIV